MKTKQKKDQLENINWKDNNIKIIANENLRFVLENSSLISPNIIRKLMSAQISNKIFGLKLSVLLSDSVYEVNTSKYFKKPLIINNKKYYMTNTWTKDSKTSLLNFIEDYS